MSRAIPAPLKNKKAAREFFGESASGGAVAGAGVSSTQVPGMITRIINFANTPMPLIDTAGVVARSALKFFDFPDGQVNILGCTVDITLARNANGVNADWDGDIAVGTVAAAGDATLTSTEANVVASTATTQAVAGVGTAKAIQSAAVTFDGTTTAVDLYLNVLVDDVDHDVTTTPTSLLVNGKITLTYAMLGDK